MLCLGQMGREILKQKGGEYSKSEVILLYASVNLRIRLHSREPQMPAPPLRCGSSPTWTRTVALPARHLASVAKRRKTYSPGLNPETIVFSIEGWSITAGPGPETKIQVWNCASALIVPPSVAEVASTGNCWLGPALTSGPAGSFPFVHRSASVVTLLAGRFRRISLPLSGRPGDKGLH